MTFIIFKIFQEEIFFIIFSRHILHHSHHFLFLLNQKLEIIRRFYRDI